MFFLFIVCQSISVSGQIFDKTSNWTEITTKTYDPSVCNIKKYELNGDTTINNLNYTKLYINGELKGGIRETQDSLIYTYFLSNEQEVLIYDFSWKVGKTIYSQKYDESTFETMCEITKIDSLLLEDGNYYEYVQTSLECKIIQGISSTFGFFSNTFYFPWNGDQTRLLCFYKGTQLVYSNPDYDFCDSCQQLYSNINEKSIINSISVSKENVSFSFNQPVKKVLIYSNQGALVRTCYVLGLPSMDITICEYGNYVYQVIAENDKVYVGKFIINNF